MKESLLILGAGQYGCLVKEIAEETGDYYQIDFLDDNNPVAIGTLEDFTQFAGEYTCAVVAIGNPRVRMEYLEKLQGCYKIPILCHPRSWVSPSARIGAGCVIEPMAVIQANAIVGAGCLICAGAVVNHNSELGEGCHIDCNSTVAARAKVSPHTKVCFGEVVFPD